MKITPSRVLPFAAAAAAILALLAACAEPAVADEPCRAYEVPMPNHRHALASYHVQEGFDVVDMAFAANVTFEDVGRLELKLSTHNVGSSPRQIIVKSFGSGGGARDIIDALWVDGGAPMPKNASGPHVVGEWAPSYGRTFARFVRGSGRRTVRGGR